MSVNFIKEENPYTLQFSYIPPQYISREQLTNEIIMDITKKIPTFRGYFLTGVRGSGKTVMMTEISKKIEERKEWIVVDIENPETNILDSLARNLYRIPKLKKLFVNAKMDFSALGIGISIEKPEMIASNEYDVIDMMLKTLKKEGKRLLVTIDEVTHCREISDFSHSLSAYARAGYDIYVLMTGLKENIMAIKNDKSLTFLYRAKEKVLEPLNTTAIIADYAQVFGVNNDFARDMAWLTKGYSFAFQVLGYLYWNALCESKGKSVELQNLYFKYDQCLAEFVYDKIWSETTGTEKRVLEAIAKSDSSQVQDIRNIIKMESSKFSVYRSRLMDKGLIFSNDYGRISLSLPRFAEYILTKNNEM